MHFTVGQTVLHYQIISRLGEGGVGTVYKAKDLQLERIVAIKVLSHKPETIPDKSRFHEEAKTAAKIVHQNICVTFEYDVFEGEQFIVMEYVEGKTLREYLPIESAASTTTPQAHRGLSIRDSVLFATQIAEGMKEAHAAGIIHRDLKPENIMITPKGQVKVMDFGLAKIKSLTGASMTRAQAGTLVYMSPEQVEGKELDQRTDIFSFGAVLYEMLTGTSPFESESIAGLMRQILEKDPESPSSANPSVDDELSYIVLKCLEKNPDLRYATIEEVHHDLVRYKKRALATDLPRAEDFRIPFRYRKSKRWMLSGVVAATVLIAAVLLYFFNPFKPAGHERISIAVVDFINESGEKELDGLSGMLITSLEQSQRLSVMTRARMLDILTQLGKTNISKIDEPLAREICVKARINVLAIASIRKFGELYTIDLKVLEPSKNEYLFTANEKDYGKENIPLLIDRLAEKTRAALNEHEGEIASANKNVAEMTSVNLEAYQKYFLGEQYIYQQRFADAQRELKEAIALDPTFALAYYRLAYSYSWHVDPRRVEPVERAMEYIDRVPEKERGLIFGLYQYIKGNQDSAIHIYKNVLEKFPESKEALWHVGDISFHRSDYDTAIVYFEKVFEIDPSFGFALQHIIIAYSRKEKPMKMIEYAKRYVTVTPTEEAFKYLAGTYLMHGDFENARSILETISNLFETSTLPIMGMADYFTFKDEYPAAEKTLLDFLQRENDPARKREAYRKLSNVYACMGKFQAALETCDKVISIDGSLQDKNDLALAYAEKGLWLWVGLRVKPEVELATARSYLTTTDFRLSLYLAKIFLRLRDFDRAREIILSPRLGVPEVLYGNVILQANIALQVGRYQDAVEQFRLFVSRWGLADPTLSINDYARSLIEAKKYSDAINLLEKYQHHYFDGWWSNYLASRAASYPESFYVQGIAYEMSGDKKSALKCFEKLLTLWKDADADLPLAAEAKMHVQKLRMGN